MDKLEYIPRDLVSVYVGIKKYIVEVIGTENENEALLYQIKFPNGEIQYADKDNIVPIPLTPEILEKNGWVKEVMSRGVKNSHWVYTKPDIEEYGYFPIYIEKGIGDEFDVYPFTDNHDCKQIAYIKYVHQLQHILFGLGLNSEMEV